MWCSQTVAASHNSRSRPRRARRMRSRFPGTLHECERKRSVNGYVHTPPADSCAPLPGTPRRYGWRIPSRMATSSMQRPRRQTRRRQPANCTKKMIVLFENSTDFSDPSRRHGCRRCSAPLSSDAASTAAPRSPSCRMTSGRKANSTRRMYALGAIRRPRSADREMPRCCLGFDAVVGPNSVDCWRR